MCTAILSLEPGAPVLLAGIRDEFTGRAWQPPGRHWPDHPDLTGGLDLLAGGTWLAVAPAARRVACVLNGRGITAPAGTRRSRGILPLRAAAEGKLTRAGVADFDPFRLLIAEPGRATLVSWDGREFAGRELTAGLHMVVNSGLASDLLTGGGDARGPGREHELARIDHFLPRFRSAARPSPRPGGPVAGAWAGWLPLLNGDGIAPGDTRALIVRRDLGGGRIWGTTSISLVAVSADGARYDFNGSPGDPVGWHPVPLSSVPRSPVSLSPADERRS